MSNSISPGSLYRILSVQGGKYQAGSTEPDVWYLCLSVCDCPTCPPNPPVVRHTAHALWVPRTAVKDLYVASLHFVQYCHRVHVEYGKSCPCCSQLSSLANAVTSIRSWQSFASSSGTTPSAFIAMQSIQTRSILGVPKQFWLFGRPSSSPVHSHTCWLQAWIVQRLHQAFPISCSSWCTSSAVFSPVLLICHASGYSCTGSTPWLIWYRPSCLEPSARLLCIVPTTKFCHSQPQLEWPVGSICRSIFPRTQDICWTPVLRAIAISAPWGTPQSIWKVSASNSATDGEILVSCGFTLLSTPSEPLSSTRFFASRGVRKARRDRGPANIFLFWFVLSWVFTRVRLLPCFFLFSTVFNLANPFFHRDLDRSWLIYSIGLAPVWKFYFVRQ